MRKRQLLDGFFLQCSLAVAQVNSQSSWLNCICSYRNVFTAQEGCWTSVAAAITGGFQKVRTCRCACFGMLPSLSHTPGKVAPMGKGQSSLVLLFEAREAFMTRRAVICGGRVLERTGASGQHSRKNMCFLTQHNLHLLWHYGG